MIEYISICILAAVIALYWYVWRKVTSCIESERRSTCAWDCGHQVILLWGEFCLWLQQIPPRTSPKFWEVWGVAARVQKCCSWKTQLGVDSNLYCVYNKQCKTFNFICWKYNMHDLFAKLLEHLGLKSKKRCKLLH